MGAGGGGCVRGTHGKSNVVLKKETFSLLRKNYCCLPYSCTWESRDFRESILPPLPSHPSVLLPSLLLVVRLGQPTLELDVVLLTRLSRGLVVRRHPIERPVHLGVVLGLVVAVLRHQPGDGVLVQDFLAGRGDRVDSLELFLAAGGWGVFGIVKNPQPLFNCRRNVPSSPPHLRAHHSVGVISPVTS